MKVKYGPYSPSRLDVAECPRHFSQKYISREIKSSDSPESKRGNVVHETFEEITKGWMSGAPLEWNQVMKVMTGLVVKYKIYDQENISIITKAARAYMVHPPSGIENIIGTEEGLAVSWDSTNNEFIECDWDDPDAVYRGKIDILIMEGTVATIIDHKTYPTIMAADTFQMRFYAWLVKQFYPFVTGVNVIMHFCRAELDTFTRPVFLSLEDIKATEDDLLLLTHAAESIPEKDAEATPHFYCTYCPIMDSCPRLEEVNELLISCSEDAANGLRDSYGIKLKKAKNDKKLKKFAETYGEIVAGSISYGIRTKKEWVPAPGMERDMWKYLESSGIDPFNYITFNLPLLKKLFFSRPPAFFESMKKYLFEKVTTSCTMRKVK